MGLASVYDGCPSLYRHRQIFMLIMWVTFKPRQFRANAILYIPPLSYEWLNVKDYKHPEVMQEEGRSLDISITTGKNLPDLFTFHHLEHVPYD